MKLVPTMHREVDDVRFLLYIVNDELLTFSSSGYTSNPAHRSISKDPHIIWPGIVRSSCTALNPDQTPAWDNTT
jgi:hypothetical protein